MRHETENKAIDFADLLAWIDEQIDARDDEVRYADESSYWQGFCHGCQETLRELKERCMRREQS